MLGQAHTPRQRLSLLAVIAFAVLVAPAVSGAIPSHGASEHTASTLRARDAALAAESRAATLEVYSLDAQLATAESRLAALQRKAAVLRAQRASLTQQLAIAKSGTRIAERHLAQQLRTLYEQGNVEPLEIVFGARSIDEAVSSLDNLSRMTEQSGQVLHQLESARVSLRSTSRRLATRQVALNSAVSSARATASSLAATRAARSSYIDSLAAQRRLTQQQIAAVVAEADAARARTEQLARVAASSAFSSAAPVADAPSATLASAAPAGARTVTVSATGYSLTGQTASGLPVGWGVVAVDPSVIPLGTHMSIPGYGEAVAADTGGAVVGSTIDLWFPTVAQANAWGRRTVAVVLR
ncbi:MAG: 3D domain-containing protein [Gaiellaceae bacterium]